jgi:uncharacterized protein (DUF1778 family)
MKRTSKAPTHGTADRPDFHSGDTKTNCSFRVYNGHLAMIHAAAERLDVSAASYMRRVVIEDAAKVLGVKPPEYASLESGTDIIAAAAKAAGMTKKEWMLREAEKSARRSLEGSDNVTRLRGKR